MEGNEHEDLFAKHRSFVPQDAPSERAFCLVMLEEDKKDDVEEELLASPPPPAGTTASSDAPAASAASAAGADDVAVKSKFAALRLIHGRHPLK